ncbi:MAG: hypothetical protein H0X42_05650 [Solirubrobacterales bacterium]|nr:hypothetical protein [Solirubrobacterales bacterium]
MRKLAIVLALLVAGLLASAAAAQAAPPVLGPVSATDIQGVSAVLVGSLEAELLATSYSFEYGTDPGFAGAVKTPLTAGGSDLASHSARAAVSGLTPDTTYHFRLVATNSSGTSTGTPSTFTTTHGFGFLPGTQGFGVSAIADGGEAATQPGSHPYRLSFTIGLNKGGEFEGQPGVDFPDGDVRDLRLEMPQGLIVNPSVVAQCRLVEFNTPRESPFENSHSGENCPGKSQVGTVEVETSLSKGAREEAEGGGEGAGLRFGLFNLVPANGVPAQLGFAPFGAPVVLNENLRPNPDGTYVLTIEAANVPQTLDITGLKLSLWGTPWGASHDGERGSCLNEARPNFPWAKCSVGEPGSDVPLAYLTLPHQCSGPLAFSSSADSWQQPAAASAAAVNRDGLGGEADLGGCTGISFAPKPFGQLTDSKASSPSGYNFTLSVDNSSFTNPKQLATPPTKEAVITLPEGVTVNPSVGAGLGFCTLGQYAAETAFSPQGAGCPNGSKLGDFTVRAAFLPEEALEGAIYLAQPNDPNAAGPENPFDSLLAVYLVAKRRSRGVLVKLPGEIQAAPDSGRLTAIFDGLPQIPYSELNLTFRTGQRAFLVTPATCGAANTSAELLPWAGSGVVRGSSASQIISGIGGGPCPSGTPPFAPAVSAGGVNSNVNSYTPYFVHIARQDSEQEITSYSLVLPKGITGKLAGIPFCPEAAIEAARHRTGFAEAASPSCPAASQVGHTDSGYGVGSSLTYAAGRVYLAGPYHGAPLSLVVINPATVGPFDLGTIVIRSAFTVDPHSAQLALDPGGSDPIPHILDGIPIHLRDVRIYMDRPQFTHNPSSCAPSALTSRVTGSGANFASEADNSSFSSSVHFQLLNCLALGFKPKLGVRLRGLPRRGAYPELRATFAARGAGDTNLKEISVSLPHSEFLAQNHIRGICTKVQFNAENCPASSVYGSAVAYTPLFDNPLRGKVYLRSSTHKLPDLVASLNSGAIHIVLEGQIGPTKQGGIEALFQELPDEPLERFTMILNGGKHGLLVNSSNICAEPPLATVKALGQNNLGASFSTILRGQCGKKKNGKKGSKS